MDKHTCEAVVVTCIDFRFQDLIDEWIKQKFGTKNHDRVAFAGGVKELEIVLNQVDLSKKLHDIKMGVFINHEECGAYGAEGTPEKHAQDLKNAASKVKEKYPEVKVEAYYLKKSGTFEKIPINFRD